MTGAHVPRPLVLKVAGIDTFNMCCDHALRTGAGVAARVLMPSIRDMTVARDRPKDSGGIG